MVDEPPHHAEGRRGRRDKRTLPHNLELERSILGGVILRPSTLEHLDALEVDDFYDHRNRAVWQAIRTLEAARRPIDTDTIGAELERREVIDAVGGYAYLGELVLKVPTADNVVEYARLVRADSLKRSIAVAAGDVLERSYAWTDDPAELLGYAHHTFEQLSKVRTDAEKPLRVMTAFQALDELSTLAQAPIYPTPYPTLNRAIGFGGFLGTQVYTVAAGTGRGKTSLVGEIAADQAQRTDVLVASYEMKPGYFVARHAAGKLGIHSNAIIRGEVSMKELAVSIPHGRLFFMHKPSLADLRRAVMRSKSKRGVPPLVCVDYIQKLAEEIMRTQARPDARLATAEASATLCEIAEETGSAILVVSAVSRASNRRTSNPRKSDPFELVDVAKESGSVEYDGAALIVVSLTKELDGDERIATWTVAKARFGTEMHIDARFHGPRGQWREIGEVTEDAADAEPDTTDLRARIVRAVTDQPAKSATEIYRRLQLERAGGARKEVVLAEVRTMAQSGELTLGQGGFSPGRIQF
jgi:replicative DNA helicase